MTATLVWLPIRGAVTGATPGVLPRRHLRRPVQPRREIRVSACEISEQIESVILGIFVSVKESRGAKKTVLSENQGNSFGTLGSDSVWARTSSSGEFGILN
ncbi:hypothetical protein U1Q18_015718 [Sarracenia purpurea var. burkii]